MFNFEIDSLFVKPMSRNLRLTKYIDYILDTKCIGWMNQRDNKRFIKYEYIMQKKVISTCGCIFYTM